MNRPTYQDADRLLAGLGCVTLGCLGLFAGIGLAVGYAIAQVLG
jgi:hypothetical protein